MLLVAVLCGGGLPSDAETDELMLEAIQAIEQGDRDALLAMLWPEMYEQNPQQIQDGIGLVIDYYRGNMQSWEAVSTKSTSNFGDSKFSKQFTNVYLVVTDTDTYYITIIRVETADGESWLHTLNLITEAEYRAATTPVGYLSDWQEFNAVQFLLAILSLATYCFIIYTFVHCIKTPLKKKGWLILLILIQVVLSFTIEPSSFRLNLTVAFFFYSRLLLYPQGGYTISFMLPLGAAIYWAIHKRFIKKELPPDAGEEALSSPGDSLLSDAAEEPLPPQEDVLPPAAEESGGAGASADEPQAEQEDRIE